MLCLSCVGNTKHYLERVGLMLILSHVRKIIKQFAADENGDIVQYLLIIALLVVFFLPDITSLQTSIKGVFSNLTSQLSSL